MQTIGCVSCTLSPLSKFLLLSSSFLPNLAALGKRKNEVIQSVFSVRCKNWKIGRNQNYLGKYFRAFKLRLQKLWWIWSHMKKAVVQNNSLSAYCCKKHVYTNKILGTVWVWSNYGNCWGKFLLKISIWKISQLSES